MAFSAAATAAALVCAWPLTTSPAGMDADHFQRWPPTPCASAYSICRYSIVTGQMPWLQPGGPPCTGQCFILTERWSARKRFARKRSPRKAGYVFLMVGFAKLQLSALSITISTSFAILSRVRSPELEIYGSTSGAYT
jgi:hypothetical protein